MIQRVDIRQEDIFVFGSNLAGVHGSGAARFARITKGAEMGVGQGFTGQCYALPTKDEKIRTLPISRIWLNICEFLDDAEENQHLTFQVTAVGCGLAGYVPEQIAPMFRSAPWNCLMPPEWEHIPELADKRFWRYE
jgi:hypothetical protein